jgi:hypothetical protein
VEPEQLELYLQSVLRQIYFWAASQSQPYSVRKGLGIDLKNLESFLSLVFEGNAHSMLPKMRLSGILRTVAPRSVFALGLGKRRS